MEKCSNMNHVNPENINIIKKIIDDFENNGTNGKSTKKKRTKTKKISNSDSFIHKYKKSQISPKTATSLDGNILRYKPSHSIEDFLQKDSDVYINFVENCDTENADANAFRKLRQRKSVFKGGKFNVEIDEFKNLMDTKSRQDRVRQNVKEVRNSI